MKLAEIQTALREEGLDGWLFFDHHKRDPLAYRVLQFTPGSMVTRRWFYFIPATGEPRGLVHRIEAETLKPLPGPHQLYASWKELADGLGKILGGAKSVAMQFSPDCAIPYVAMVDAGTVDLVRGLGVQVVSCSQPDPVFRIALDGRSVGGASGSRAQSGPDSGRGVSPRLGEGSGERTRHRMGDAAVHPRRGFAESGLVTDHGPDIAVNANASNPHYEPKQEASSEIRPGDWCLMDMWAKLDKPEGVYYDITWVGYCGPEAPAAIDKVFGVVREARDRAVACVMEAVAREADPTRI